VILVHKSFKIKNLKFAIAIVFCLASSDAVAQSGVHITNYSPTETRSGNQNWDISTDGRRMYFANNNGLLVMEGQNSRLYPLPERTIVRSVAHIDGRIYTGSYEEVGYWTPNEDGDLSYTSLMPLLEGVTLTHDEFWRIVAFKGDLYFQSFGILLKYDGQTIKPVDMPGPMMFMHVANGRMFGQLIRGGLYEMTDAGLIELPGSRFLSGTEVKTILPLSDTDILIGTGTEGVYRYDGTRFSRWAEGATRDLVTYQLNNGVRSGDFLIFGTILKGLFVYRTDGSRVNHIHSETLLQNNTVLSMLSDDRGNLWVGMDKGFDYVAFDTPVRLYRDIRNDIGSVYTAALHKNELFVGTNQGIYYYRRSADGTFTDRRFIRGSEGQVWFLQVIDGYLYAGLNDGTFLIENHMMRRVSDITGGYNLKRISTGDGGVLLQSSYNEVVVYRKRDGIWQKDHLVEGFRAPSRFLEMDHLGNIWLGHSIKGVYKVQPDDRFTTVVSVEDVGRDAGLDESTNRVFSVDNRIIVSTSTSVYQWDAINRKMIAFPELFEALGNEGGILNVIPIGSSRYWILRRHEIGMYDIRFGQVKLLYRLVPEMYNLNLVENYENVVVLNDRLHLFCLDDGFAILDYDAISGKEIVTAPPLLSEAHIWRAQGERKSVLVGSGSQRRISNTYSNLEFSWVPPMPGGNKAFFQYRLIGYDSKWTEWSSKTSVAYLRLPHGEYSFEVRMLTETGFVTESARFDFRILPPWYLSPLAYLLYVVMGASFLGMIRLYFSRKRWKSREQELRREHEIVRLQKEKMESELVHLSNENLQNEIAHKSAQLANSTMAMVRKNEVLGEIKQELDSQKLELGARMPTKYYNRLTRLIDQEMKNESEWEAFEALYDQAHGDFFKRLKADFSGLTPSDLRLCAYLRMNLSSKEIAPLLNITVRGVEERRYRLRKRMNLGSDENLTERIMTY
jgi:DNA-binding CsgD family transcriptional regulator